jgi:TrmH family RNA methyltransferase
VKQISSSQNAYIKSLVQLQEKAKRRKETGTFLIEGLREIELALAGSYVLETVLFDPNILDKQDVEHCISADTEWIEITSEVYQKLAYRDTTEGVLALAQVKSLQLGDLQLGPNPLILVAEAPEKPGNIGAILRTADAAKVDAVLIANPKNDVYNPNTIRSSVGTVFTNQIATGSSAEIIAYLKTNQIAIYSAILQESEPYYTQNFTKATAIVVGTEATGLTQEWREAAAQNIHIPMQGAIDSMNVSVAAAILIFEAKRQRGF